MGLSVKSPNCLDQHGLSNENGSKGFLCRKYSFLSLPNCLILGHSHQAKLASHIFRARAQ